MNKGAMFLAGGIQVAFLLAQLFGFTSCQVGPHSPFFHENVEGRGLTTINFIGAFTRKFSPGAVAARIAVKDINAFNSRLNSNVYLNLTEREDTECILPKVQSALSSLNLVSNPTTHHVILAGCHAECNSIAQQLITSSIDALIMCYGLKNSTYAEFEDGPNFPGLFFVSHEMLSVPLSLANFVMHVGWEKVAVLSSAAGYRTELYVTMADNFDNILSQHGVQVSHFDISVENSIPGSKVFPDLDRLQELNFRIMFVFADQLVSQMLLCQIYRRSLYDPRKFVWFFAGSTNSDSLTNNVPSFSPDLDCTPEQLLEAADGHFIAYPSFWNPNGQQLSSVSRKTSNEVRQEVIQNLQRAGEHITAGFNEAAFAYDAVWAAYIATISSLLNCRLQNGLSPLCHYYNDKLNDVQFPGVSGTVSFHGGRRSPGNAIIRIEKYCDRKYTLVALHFNSNGSLHWLHGHPFKPITPGDGSFEPVPQNSASSSYTFDFFYEFLVPIYTALIIISQRLID